MMHTPAADDSLAMARFCSDESVFCVLFLIDSCRLQTNLYTISSAGYFIRKSYFFIFHSAEHHSDQYEMYLESCTEWDIVYN